MAINKKEFADRMAKNGGITKKVAYKAVDAFIGIRFVSGECAASFVVVIVHKRLDT